MTILESESNRTIIHAEKVLCFEPSETNGKVQTIVFTLEGGIQRRWEYETVTQRDHELWKVKEALR